MICRQMWGKDKSRVREQKLPANTCTVVSSFLPRFRGGFFADDSASPLARSSLHEAETGVVLVPIAEEFATGSSSSALVSAFRFVAGFRFAVATVRAIFGTVRFSWKSKRVRI